MSWTQPDFLRTMVCAEFLRIGAGSACGSIWHQRKRSVTRWGRIAGVAGRCGRDAAFDAYRRVQPGHAECGRNGVVPDRVDHTAK